MIFYLRFLCDPKMRCSPRFSLVTSGLDSNFISYSLCTVASTIMGSVFNFYYVYFFLDVYKVSHSCFQFSQMMFLVWNAINDPLFGWIQVSKIREKRVLVATTVCIAVEISFFL